MGWLILFTKGLPTSKISLENPDLRLLAPSHTDTAAMLHIVHFPRDIKYITCNMWNIMTLDWKVLSMPSALVCDPGVLGVLEVFINIIDEYFQSSQYPRILHDNSFKNTNALGILSTFQSNVMIFHMLQVIYLKSRGKFVESCGNTTQYQEEV